MKNIHFRRFVITGLWIVIIFGLGRLSSNINLFYNDILSSRISEPEVNCDADNDTLVDLHNFKFIMNNVSLCMPSMTSSVANLERKQSAIAIIVHSARSHFENRHAIRNTWGSVKMFKGWHLHLTFLLGIDPNSDPEIESRLKDESRKHGDIIMGNFVDSYRNLTYKHLMGYKWVTTFCPSAKFILKTDDDMYADVFQVVDVLLAELIMSEKTYICKNMAGNVPCRDVSKWQVSKDEFPEDKYPAFCSGSAYLMTADGAEKIYATSNKTKFFWIDDVFVTGILREKYILVTNDSSSLEIRTIHGQDHLGNKAEILSWCKKGFVTGQLSYTFILIEDKHKHRFIREMFCIWNKVRLLRFAMNNAITSDITTKVKDEEEF